MNDTTPTWLVWIERALAVAALMVVGWVLLTESGGILHSHPAYAVLLAITVGGALTVGIWSLLSRRGRAGWRRAIRILGAVAGAGWIFLIAWLCPFSADEPALDAMRSNPLVAVEESSTLITFTPTGETSDVALVFQPGARVDPRAYAAVLRPLAEAGHPVVIVKQPLGIAFLATNGYSLAVGSGVEATQWAIGGHSLGGTVAALEAEAVADGGESLMLANGTEATGLGLLLFASYPAGDMSDYSGSVLSISGSEDGLATPDSIMASVDDLPGTTSFVVIQGGNHAQFGSYGNQPGDGASQITDEEAQEQISEHALDWLTRLTPQDG